MKLQISMKNSLHFFLFMLYIPAALRMIFLIYRVLYRIYSSRRSAAIWRSEKKFL